MKKLKNLFAKLLKIAIPLIVPAGIFFVLYYVLNPNNKPWKDQNGDPVNMADYPLTGWLLSFGKNIKVAGRDDLTGVKSGRKITWSNGYFWTY